MRLDEIIPINQTIINLKGIQVKFTDEYELITETHEFFIDKQLGKQRHGALKGNIDDLRERIAPFLNYTFYADPDIDRLKSIASNMLVNVDRIEKEIP